MSRPIDSEGEIGLPLPAFTLGGVLAGDGAESADTSLDRDPLRTAAPAAMAATAAMMGNMGTPLYGFPLKKCRARATIKINEFMVTGGAFVRNYGQNPDSAGTLMV